MVFSPASSTVMSATPVGPSARRTPAGRPRPAASRASASPAASSSPTAARSATSAPSRRAAEPGWRPCHRAPGGSRSPRSCPRRRAAGDTRATRSRFTLPTTTSRMPRHPAREFDRISDVFTTRPVLSGTFGMVATTHWLATAAGMAVLEAGGNAVDAAAAAGFALHVVEPHLNGPGGDVPADRRPGRRPRRRRCSAGRAPLPAAATVEAPRRARADAGARAPGRWPPPCPARSAPG